MPRPSKVEQQAILARLDTFSRLTDSSVPIPFTRFSVGLEAIIGLIPVIGDLAGLLLASYVLIEAQRAGATRTVKLRILANIAIDFFGGLIPVVGDVFDAFYKANTRNTKLVREFLEANDTESQ
ncbi:DUF4112 domain-containing protein [Gilvimarinus sp. SDUM040013]|uniref:DUF4112 domain-containing protein n=1 Tax=Gilvimarinus gilvus TaxID=3058038 RepID=A0ABU4S1F1_9GAMM|nr:DUF4112 domain-containing protein [Gilvimarinus sp. SDUM040013]MDO3387169.1 DUF4112 domain-containing protein [Gilvimarinus sp. SDUM040013]MDX6850912.1 DUF4112 domain-containing protein [Gilvimarinus sp. SDUM040013]